MTPLEHSKNEPDSTTLKSIHCLTVGTRKINLQDYDGRCSIGYCEVTTNATITPIVYYWMSDGWKTKHGPFHTASEAFVAWESWWDAPKATPRPGHPTADHDILTLPKGPKAPKNSFDVNRWKNRGTTMLSPDETEQVTESTALTAVKQECKAALSRVMVRQAYPGAKVCSISSHTCRVNVYTRTDGIIPIN